MGPPKPNKRLIRPAKKSLPYPGNSPEGKLPSFVLTKSRSFFGLLCPSVTPVWSVFNCILFGIAILAPPLAVGRSLGVRKSWFWFNSVLYACILLCKYAGTFADRHWLSYVAVLLWVFAVLHAIKALQEAINEANSAQSAKEIECSPGLRAELKRMQTVISTTTERMTRAETDIWAVRKRNIEAQEEKMNRKFKESSERVTPGEDIRMSNEQYLEDLEETIDMLKEQFEEAEAEVDDLKSRVEDIGVRVWKLEAGTASSPPKIKKSSSLLTPWDRFEARN